MLNREMLEKAERALERDLDKLLSKNELSAADWDAVKKAMCIANMISGYMNGEMVGEDGMSYGYNGSSNGYSRAAYGMYGDGYGERGRSPVTGRYVSRGYSNEGMGYGYSGHSIEDRMIMALEQQMDSTKTEYERSQIEKEIKRIRRGE